MTLGSMVHDESEIQFCDDFQGSGQIKHVKKRRGSEVMRKIAKDKTWYVEQAGVVCVPPFGRADRRIKLVYLH